MSKISMNLAKWIDHCWTSTVWLSLFHPPSNARLFFRFPAQKIVLSFQAFFRLAQNIKTQKIEPICAEKKESLLASILKYAVPYLEFHHTTCDYVTYYPSWTILNPLSRPSIHPSVDPYLGLEKVQEKLSKYPPVIFLFFPLYALTLSLIFVDSKSKVLNSKIELVHFRLTSFSIRYNTNSLLGILELNSFTFTA